MKKNLLKISLFGSAFLAVLLIPGNANYVFGYGDAPTFAGSSTNPPTKQNDNVEPGTPVVYQPGHSLLLKSTKPGSVTLNWVKVKNATTYTIGYGLKSGQYIYGVPSTGDITNFTIDHLNPGTLYYFVVRGNNDGKPGPWSREWTFRPGGFTGYKTNLLTNTADITLPSNITTPQTVSTAAPQEGINPNGAVQGVQTTAPAAAQGTAPAATAQSITIPTAVPQVGFFEGMWKGFLGVFGL